MSQTVTTELAWEYVPADFFEAPFHRTTADYEVEIGDGRAKVTLVVPHEQLPEALRNDVLSEIDNIFRVRAIQTGRQFKLQYLKEAQIRSDGSRTNQISITAKSRIVSRGQADFVLRDKDGNVLRDTRAERIAEETSYLNSVAAKLRSSKTLESMVESYNRAVSDPENELVHLYEIRDAALKEFGSESVVRSTLKLSKAKWSRLGSLSNDLPLKQGRHRGRKFDSLRDATPAELADARSIAREILDEFVAYLP